MLSWKFKRRTAEVDSAMVGIAISQSEITMVAFDGEVEGRPHMVAWDTLSCDSSGELPSQIKKFVDDKGLQGWSCRCTLSPGDYSLRLVERPTNVPDEELVDATRWLIRDLVEFDIEMAELAILTIPADSSRARTPRMFVVAARHEVVLDLAHAIESAGLCLMGFDIVESSMLTLEGLMPGVVAGSAALHIDDKSSLLTLSHAEHLYLARNLHVDADSIETAGQHALNDDNPSNPEVAELLAPLLLDIQRSLDYYESEYGQAPASRLTLLPSQIDLAPLVPALSEALRPTQVESFDLPLYFDIEELPPTSAYPSIAIAGGSVIAGAGLLGNALVPALFKGSPGGFGLLSALQIATAFTVLLGLYSIASWTWLGQEQQTLTTLEAESTRIDEKIESLHAETLARLNGVDPATKVQTLRAERDARLALLRDLGQRSTDSDASFSNLLAGLARQDLEGVWLERIEFSDGGESITIEGRSLQAEDVPAFLRGLGDEKSFEQRTFRTFEIERQTTSAPGLAFRIATLGKDTPSDGDVR